ncbi:MAG: NADH:ubiquinone oxidoreductase subunit NDUFA12 [bacterium]|nr:NADH:ubiquinone oxidoreductase subunit NDUFA12 [bacterium]
MNRFLCFFFGNCVGQDDYGNRYFEGRWAGPQGVPRRWVSYKSNKNEPSGVPAEWHGWVHQTDHIPPRQSALDRFFWQKPHAANRVVKSIPTLATHTLRDYAPWRPATSRAAVNNVNRKKD